MINANGIELMAGALDPAGVQHEVGRLRAAANGIRTVGENVNDRWSTGLNEGVYHAPEGDLLRTAAKPVQTETARFGWQLWQVAQALDTYAAEIAPIKSRLQTLLTEANAFLAKADPMGTEWLKDDDMVKENNRLESAVRGQAEALLAAEERCAAKIYAAYGGHAPAPICTDTPPASTIPPWGTPEKADLPWYYDAWNGAGRFGKGIWDVTWGGFSSLVGLQGGKAFKESWTGLGKWAATSFIVSFPGAQTLLMIPSVRKMVWDSHVSQFKGLTAWDEWRRDPARASGQVVGNILMLATLKKTGPKATTFAGRGAQMALKGARFFDPLTTVTMGGTKAANLLRGLRSAEAAPVKLDADLPRLEDPTKPPTIGRPGAGDFEIPGKGPAEVKPPHLTDPQLPREPALAGPPRTPQELNNTHTPPGPDKPPPSSPQDPPPTHGKSPSSGETPGQEGQPTSGGEPTSDSGTTPPHKTSGTDPSVYPGERGGHQAPAPDPRTVEALEHMGLTKEGALRLLGPPKRANLRMHIEGLIDQADTPGRPTSSQVATALRDLDTAMNSGKLHPHSFGQLLANLHNASHTKQFMERHSEIMGARDVIETADLAPGTQVLTHATLGRHPIDLGGGVTIDIGPVHQADLLYKTSDGIFHLEDVKDTPNALDGNIDKSQHRNINRWYRLDPEERKIGYRMPREEGWTDLFRYRRNIFQRLYEKDYHLTVGKRTLTPVEVRDFRAAIGEKYVEWLKQNPGRGVGDFYAQPEMRTLEDALRYAHGR
ncbi:hypothetical protein [Actinomadura fibrosa]|uniref:Uncharacterized protein n=1 Tax=Actinomadura fibrosa TaxID=111802 RepID=A0ABW2Y0P1_9ACTN|nr:hypothetical protein [Actinomadura fibrosa]